MNKKHGFTISELLISIAIISIVSAMGMTIAKRGTDDAYKNYFSVGTINLNNALAQLETGDVNLTLDIGVLGGMNSGCNKLTPRMEYVRDQWGRAIPNPNVPDPRRPNDYVMQKMAANPTQDIFKNTAYRYFIRTDRIDEVPVQIADTHCADERGPMWLVNNLRYLFDDTDNLKQSSNPGCNGALNNNAQQNCRINAGNGITYEIIEIGQLYDNRNHVFPNKNYIRIMMTVPAPRTRQNPSGRARTEFLYCRNANAADRTGGGIDIRNLASSHLLIPMDSPTLNRADIQNIPYFNLQDREDLLTAYIDDGVVGRHVPRYNNEDPPENNEDPPEIDHYDFMPIRYGTFRDSLCSILNIDNNNMGNNYLIDGERIVNCQPYNDNNVPRIQHARAVYLFLDNAGNQIQNRDAAGNIIGTAPSSGTIKFASPRKLK